MYEIEYLYLQQTRERINNPLKCVICFSQQIIQMTTHHHSNHVDDHFRQTGKFKPLLDFNQYLSEQPLQPTFKVSIASSASHLGLTQANKTEQQESKWWRIYFEQTISTIDRDSLSKTVQNCFLFLFKNNQLVDQKSTDLFINTNGVLIERIRGDFEEYYLSNLDFNCLLVRFRTEVKESAKFIVQCFQAKPLKKLQEEKEFIEEIFIKMKEELNLFYLIFRNRTIYLVKDKLKQFPILEITDQNLEQSTAEIPNQELIIKNLSLRIISIKFLENSCMKSTEPLQIIINNNEIYQTILFKINRLKYHRYRVEESESKLWHSFDQKLKSDNKKESKTTPEKLKIVSKGAVLSPNANKVSNQSTNFVEEQHQINSKKNSNKINVVAQQKHLKISQRVMTNPKESNLVASELDFSVSVKDENEKESGYYDDFQNLLYDDRGEEKQLSLNDSFEEFQKKGEDAKSKQILAELSRRREKETQEKKVFDSLKGKMVQLMSDEKEWIDKNFKLKIEIKKIQKSDGNSQQNKQIEDIKNKINELKKYEKKLLEELSCIRFENNIEVLVFGNPNSNHQSNESQRKKQETKMFHSINGFSPLKMQPEPIASSVRKSNNSDYLLKINNQSPSSKGTDKSKPLKTGLFPKKINQNPVCNPSKDQEEMLNIYSSVPATKSFINEYPGSIINNPNSKSNIKGNSSQTFLTFSPKIPSRYIKEPSQGGQASLFFKMSPQGSQKKLITPFTLSGKP